MHIIGRGNLLKIMLNIKELLGNSYLDKFKVFHPQTLFEPAWENLKEKRCPLCFNKLKIPLKGYVAICSSNRHSMPFVIGLNKLNKLIK